MEGRRGWVGRGRKDEVPVSGSGLCLALSGEMSQAGKVGNWLMGLVKPSLLLSYCCLKLK